MIQHLTKAQEKALKKQKEILQLNCSYRCETCQKTVQTHNDEDTIIYCSACSMKGRISRLVKVEVKKPKRTRSGYGKVTVTKLDDIVTQSAQK